MYYPNTHEIIGTISDGQGRITFLMKDFPNATLYLPSKEPESIEQIGKIICSDKLNPKLRLDSQMSVIEYYCRHKNHLLYKWATEIKNLTNLLMHKVEQADSAIVTVSWKGREWTLEVLPRTVEQFRVIGDETRMLDSGNLVEIAEQIEQYPFLLAIRKKEIEELQNYYQKNIFGKRLANISHHIMTYYSDRFYDLYGYRPNFGEEEKIENIIQGAKEEWER